ncbi:uncharacterized protein LOC127641512 [Xyrauchen texanus]|uniref:uncharacterized protein LOC127641512 n=1 Tax=Xyrauchen texanus TaxID=154827 RepID=UPI002241F65E|nr:uncharacterized protein LOC127641512 [Xyrauchen texanus]
MIPTLKLTKTLMTHLLHQNTIIIPLILTHTIIVISTTITSLTLIQKVLLTLNHPIIMEIIITHNLKVPKIIAHHIPKSTATTTVLTHSLTTIAVLTTQSLLTTTIPIQNPNTTMILSLKNLTISFQNLNLINTTSKSLKTPTISLIQIPIITPIQSLTILIIMSIQNSITILNQIPTVIIPKITIITMIILNPIVKDHHNDDHPSPLRHSPVGQRSTSPHSTKSDSSASSIVHDDQSTVSYQATSPFPKETDSELQRLIMLQEQNEVLNHSLLQTTVRMECMGAEFKTGHQLLESELQRTRIELNCLMDRFTRLQDNYSSTQQTNHHLEKKLHCVAQSMDGERERLNQRVSQLTEQLSAAKTTIQSLETINVTSMLQDALVKHLKSDDPITPLPVAPPPAQFMDSDHYDKRDDQSLGTLPEEEESDWSEMGEEVLMVSQGTHENTYFQWQQRQGCWEGANQYGRGNADTESESGGEENKTHQPPHGLQIPHLKFTVHPETLPVPIQDVSLARFKQSPDGPESESYQITDVRNLGSPIRVLSASLEEIHSIGLLKMQDDHGQLRSNKSMMDLHHTQVGTRQVSYVDDIVCNWRETNSQGSGEDVSGMVDLESAQKMLNHFIHDGESTHL